MPFPSAQKGNLLNLTVLDVAEKDPVTPPIPTERASSPEKKSEPREEEPTDLPAPNGWQASEPEGAICSGELALHAEKTATCTPWIYWFMGRQVWPTPIKEVDSTVNIPLGA